MPRDYNGELISARLGDNETGWVQPIQGYPLAVIKNIPFDEHCDYHLHDIVELIDADAEGGAKLGEVVWRRHSLVTCVRYAEQWEVEQILIPMFKQLGCACEGLAPSFLMVAHESHIDPEALATAAGVHPPKEDKDDEEAA